MGICKQPWHARVLSILFLFIVSGIPGAYAEIDTLVSRFEIDKDQQVTQFLNLSFSSPVNTTMTLYLDSLPALVDLLNHEGIAVQVNLTQVNESAQLVITPLTPVEELSLKIAYDELIFSRDDSYLFYLELGSSLPIEEASASLRLPEGHIARAADIRPSTQILSSRDAKTYEIFWNEIEETSPLTLSVGYRKIPESSDTPLLLLLLMVFLIAGVGFVFLLRKNRNAFLLGFREDEQKVINLLKERREILQKELEKEFGFSRAKSTRIVKKLEEKELITKEPFGRTNRISWVGQ